MRCCPGLYGGDVSFCHFSVHLFYTLSLQFHCLTLTIWFVSFLHLTTLCCGISPLENIAYDEGSQFIELHYSGRGSWNEETETDIFPGTETFPANVLNQDAYKVKDYKSISERSVFKMPDLPQFDPSVCTSRAAQCCWPRDRQARDNNGNCHEPYDVNCVDKDVADNTDLCYNELDKAPYANGVYASGFSTYDDEGPIHCHGFAWSTEEQEVSSRYKANALFFVSMYDHMYQRGYVGNIPGSPMCGCVEHVSLKSSSMDCFFFPSFSF